MTVFISFIGKGKTDERGQFKYERVNYSFKNSSVETSCFANAVMRSGEFSFDRVRIIGTVSSSWDQLLEDPSAEEEDLYLELDKASPEKLTALRPALTDALKKRWNVVDVDLLIHPAELTGNEDRILESYLDLMLANTGDIVLDVTHSFRWMPQFLASAMELADAFSNPRSVQILYGELSTDKKSCPVRILDPLWDARKLAMDVRMFFEKWEAEPLALRLEPVWPSGAKALRNLGNHLQGNYLVPLVWDKDGKETGKPLLALRNALNDFRKIENPPFWVKRIVAQLKRLLEKITAPATHSEQLLTLAELYAERRIYGQALLCQEIALRIFLWEQKGNTGYPTWEDVKDLIKDFYEPEWKDYQTKKSISDNRNNVAHGALQSPEGTGGSCIPYAGNLPSQFERQQEYLKRLFGGKS